MHDELMQDYWDAGFVHADVEWDRYISGASPTLAQYVTDYTLTELDRRNIADRYKPMDCAADVLPKIIADAIDAYEGGAR